MTKKLIAIDLDGTTLNAQSLITARTQEILTKARQAGHIVSIATGRPYRMSEQFYRQLNLDSPMVNFNGALVHLPEQKWPYESEHSIDREIAFSILEQKATFNLDFVAAENRESFYVDQIEGVEPHFFATQQITEQNLMKHLKTNPTSLLLKTQHEFAADVSSRLMEQFNKEIDVRTWGGPNAILEVVPKGVQKAMGVDIIANSLGIKQQDVIAFGDEHNDLELLDYAGWGVAMKNGTDQLKQVANDQTIKTNDEDGLADYLERYLSL
ncbi:MULTISPECIES: Cof-type HAD-IIB family hydrolase [Enterococcus]|uniref:HAD superfamily hydrolase n=1 Tax=Enterococcus sulfureus ATCC 49903 TaxID=1140003 RepID=S0P081_9ENTE|nr:Cof-type HAD-IIB family hydrolase [Enterococcus sulfureus]EOT51302.1 HAD superfamily hydrolase [Enterococcus sulfureus ATCC 49903]EOT86959.1 HAD superfamily hydrolase [Enterococcus sulfureus ATCC 49903]